MAEQLADFLRDKIPAELAVFVISMLPILELRGGMVAAAVLNVNFWLAFPICVIGNILPIPFELLFIRRILKWLKGTKLFCKLATKLEEKAHKKAEDKSIQKYKHWGLFLFVAIPLPGTGAWTGGLVADVLDLRIKTALPIITLGVITAGLIMAVIAYVIPYLITLI
ncbi:MAG: small multi-drug export protein [Clostridia bacterium]|nr:small multi-drug export protein [Clostridia bacterium]